MSTKPQQVPFSEADLLSAGATLCYIYTLHASNDPECRPRYVGFTIVPRERECQHNGFQQYGRKGDWAKEVLSSGGKIVLTPVFRFRSDNLEERALVEAGFIESYRKKYPDLLNDSGGGGGVAVCSERLRKIRSAMNRGRVHSEETRAKVRASKLGKKRPEYVVEKLKKAALGRKHSKETVELIRKNSTGRKLSQEAKDRISRANKGRTYTPAQIARMCGKPRSEEAKAKQSAKMKLFRHTPEAREKIRQASLRMWEAKRENSLDDY